MGLLSLVNTRPSATRTRPPAIYTVHACHWHYLQTVPSSPDCPQRPPTPLPALTRSTVPHAASRPLQHTVSVLSRLDQASAAIAQPPASSLNAGGGGRRGPDGRGPAQSGGCSHADGLLLGHRGQPGALVGPPVWCGDGPRLVAGGRKQEGRSSAGRPPATAAEPPAGAPVCHPTADCSARQRAWCARLLHLEPTSSCCRRVRCWVLA